MRLDERNGQIGAVQSVGNGLCAVPEHEIDADFPFRNATEGVPYRRNPVNLFLRRSRVLRHPLRACQGLYGVLAGYDIK
jgi:hypothetical protein